MCETDFVEWKPTKALCKCVFLLARLKIGAALEKVTIGRSDLTSNGMVTLPEGNSRWLRSRKRASMFCSRHSCLTDSSVYLKSGTYRTLETVMLTVVLALVLT